MKSLDERIAQIGSRGARAQTHTAGEPQIRLEEILTLPKKPKSKPAAKKVAAKAVAKPQSLTGLDRRLIDDMAERVDELVSELKAANKKLDFVVSRLGGGNGEEFEN
jgi:hypothetical protein